MRTSVRTVVSRLDYEYEGQLNYDKPTMCIASHSLTSHRMEERWGGDGLTQEIFQVRHSTPLGRSLKELLLITSQTAVKYLNSAGEDSFPVYQTNSRLSTSTNCSNPVAI
jgi:hypothetical protein